MKIIRAIHLTSMNVLNVVNVLNVLRMTKDASLAWWALFHYIASYRILVVRSFVRSLIRSFFNSFLLLLCPSFGPAGLLNGPCEVYPKYPWNFFFIAVATTNKHSSSGSTFISSIHSAAFPYYRSPSLHQFRPSIRWPSLPCTYSSPCLL